MQLKEKVKNIFEAESSPKNSDKCTMKPFSATGKQAKKEKKA